MRTNDLRHALSIGGFTVRSISRKTAAWASGAVIAVGGTTAGIIAATSSGGGTANGNATAKASVAAHAKSVRRRLVSISPGNDAGAPNGATGVTVTYTEPLPPSAPMPTLK